MRNNFLRILTLALALGISSFATPGALAQDEHEQLIQRGIELRRAGQDEEALGYFQQAYDLEATPRAAAQLGLAAQALGMWPRSYTLLGEALAANDPWIEENRSALESARETAGQRIATLELRGGSAGAEVLVDGIPSGNLPLENPLVVRPGAHTVEIRQEGYRPAIMELTLSPGDAARETVRLVPLAPTPAEAAAATETPNPTGPLPVTPEPEESSASPVGPILLGVGVATIGGAVAALLIGENAASTWNDDEQCLVGNATRGETCGEFQTRAERSRVIGGVLAAAGGALALTGIVLWAAGDGDDEDESANLSCTPGLASLDCRMEF